MAADLRSNAEALGEIRHLTGVTATDLRLLDISVWSDANIAARHGEG
jgi:hypothetical protein